MIIQIFNRVNDVRDSCEQRCEQLRHLIKPMYRPVQRVHPFPFLQNESFNLIGTTTSIITSQQINEPLDKDSNAKMDKKQRYKKANEVDLGRFLSVY